jgi:S-formylglutathione hydrolase FrmB
MLTRRQLLLGAAGLVGAGAVAAAVPGAGRRLDDLLHPVPEPPHPVPSGGVGTRISGSFRSDAMQRVIGSTVAYPGAPRRGLPFLLVLHGRGASNRTAFRDLHYGEFLSDAVRRGVPPFAVVTVDGGDHSYWHPRASGIDPPRMLLDELFPRLAERGLRTDRFAVGGWSMGGYGALLLAEQLGPTRVASVTPDSPAISLRFGDTAAGAFDSAADFREHDVLDHLDALGDIPVRVTCGTSDPFLPGSHALVRRLPRAERDFGPGEHDDAWWQHVAPAQLAFAGRALALG